MDQFFREGDASVVMDGKIAILHNDEKTVGLYSVEAVYGLNGDQSVRAVIRLEGSWTRLNTPWHIADTFVRSGVSPRIFEPG